MRGKDGRQRMKLHLIALDINTEDNDYCLLQSREGDGEERKTSPNLLCTGAGTPTPMSFIWEPYSLDIESYWEVT